MFLDNGISDVVCKMRIIYSASNLNFANKINANLTIMRDVEHLFHTDEQMDFLDNRFKKNI
mgnify:CR=1 FL=1